jgi:hypothetical protein
MKIFNTLFVVAVFTAGVNTTMAQFTPTNPDKDLTPYVKGQPIVDGKSFQFLLTDFENFSRQFDLQDVKILEHEVAQVKSYEQLRRKKQAQLLLGVCKQIDEVKASQQYSTSDANIQLANLMVDVFEKVDELMDVLAQQRYQKVLGKLSQNGRALLADKIIPDIAMHSTRKGMDWRAFAEQDAAKFVSVFGQICNDKNHLRALSQSSADDFEVKVTEGQQVSRNGDTLGHHSVSYQLKEKGDKK